MRDLFYLFLLIPGGVLYVWVALKLGAHESHHWASALGVPLFPPNDMPPGLGRQREAMLKICVASGYTTTSEFLVGAEKAFLLLTQSACKGDMQERTELASASARSRISDCVGIYTSEMASFAEIVDARNIGHRAFVSVRFGRPRVHPTVWEEPRDWAEARQRVRTAIQTWTFERDLRSADPNWFLVDVHDPTESDIAAPPRC